MSVLKDILLVGAGGALGSIMRYGLTLLSSAIHISPQLGTLTANICGSFLIGIFIILSSNTPAYLFGAIGLCGGFTTFSTFSAQVLDLIQTGEYGTAAIYAIASVVICILFVALGLYVGKMLK